MLHHKNLCKISSFLHLADSAHPGGQNGQGGERAVASSHTHKHTFEMLLWPCRLINFAPSWLFSCLSAQPHAWLPAFCALLLFPHGRYLILRNQCWWVFNPLPLCRMSYGHVKMLYDSLYMCPQNLKYWKETWRLQNVYIAFSWCTRAAARDEALTGTPVKSHGLKQSDRYHTADKALTLTLDYQI